MKLLIFIIGLTISLSCFSAQPDKLKRVNTSISSLQKTIKKEKRTRYHFQNQLKQTELKSAAISKKLHETEEKLKKQRLLLNTLNDAITRDKNQLDSEKNQLAVLLQQAYQLGKAPLLKALLDQSTLEHSERMLVYYRYLSEAQATLLTTLQTTLNQLKANQAKLSDQTQALVDLKKVQQAEKIEIGQTQKKRLTLISKINQQIDTRKKKLAILLENKKQLQNTLLQLNTKSNHTGAFSMLKGHLKWPTQGHLLNYFNKPIEHSELKWEGIIIRAPENQPVRAVASGKVVFAKWMPGYGLLLIISHGNGYMTLYGRNHFLYKKVGDTVEAGDLIARVGKSGGYQKFALYFGIRHEAKPLNPMQWCQ